MSIIEAGFLVFFVTRKLIHRAPTALPLLYKLLPKRHILQVLVGLARGVTYPTAAAEVVGMVEVLILFNLVLVEAFFQKLKPGVQAQKAIAYAHTFAGAVEVVVDM